MGKTMYRWIYREEGKTRISGVVLAETYDDAVEKTKEYLEHQFDDINGKMNLVASEDTTNIKLVTLWVWGADIDDDYNNDFPDCLAVAYRLNH